MNISEIEDEIAIFLKIFHNSFVRYGLSTKSLIFYWIAKLTVAFFVNRPRLDVTLL